MKTLSLETVINGMEVIDSNMMQMLQGGFSPMDNCNCGSGNNNAGQSPIGDCTCGLGNNNSATGQLCTCGSGNSNLVKPEPVPLPKPSQRKLQFG